jgi:hypothetical protein
MQDLNKMITVSLEMTPSIILKMGAKIFSEKLVTFDQATKSQVSNNTNLYIIIVPLRQNY